jgi:L-lactate dehydrogenase (cytochrome)
MAGGERGVDHLASLLRTDYIRTLRLLGVTQTEDLTADLVELQPILSRRTVDS